MKVYVVRTSEDGNIGVATSAKKALKMMLSATISGTSWDKTRETVLSELRSGGTTVYLSDKTEIDVEAWDTNYCFGRNV